MAKNEPQAYFLNNFFFFRIFWQSRVPWSIFNKISQLDCQFHLHVCSLNKDICVGKMTTISMRIGKETFVVVNAFIMPGFMILYSLAEGFGSHVSFFFFG